MEILLDDFIKLKLKDEIFIIETDTVYGIGCLYNSKKGAERIRELKERDNTKFFSILVSSFDQIKSLTTNSDIAKNLIDKYWPGEVTLIFNKSKEVGDFVSNNNTVGLRMPNNENTLKALNAHGPMIMTSLNKSGEKEILKYKDCLKYLNKVDYIVIGNDLNGIPSTVYDVENKKVIREGKIKIS